MELDSVLGLELQLACDLLEAEGYRVQTQELRSRKGLDGNEARVIRVCPHDGGSVELCWSLFKTDLRFAAE